MKIILEDSDLQIMKDITFPTLVEEVGDKILMHVRVTDVDKANLFFISCLSGNETRKKEIENLGIEVTMVTKEN